MEDPKALTDVATLAVTAWASKELAGKLLGPTFDYIGGEVRNFAAKCNVNLSSVFTRARRKLGEQIETPGGVSPRVLKDVLDQGAFADNPMAAEYIAGVLGASRTPESTDDRGVTYLAVVRQMSTLQLRAHYVIYQSLKTLLDGQALNALNVNEAAYMQIFMSMPFLRDNLAFSADDNEHTVLAHVLNGLARHDLIDTRWWGGDERIVLPAARDVAQAGYFVQPTGFGVELLFWAHGITGVDVSAFLAPELVLQPFPDITVQGVPTHYPDRSADMARERAERNAFVMRTIAERQNRL